MMSKEKKSPDDFLLVERPDESFYEKESRRADAISAKERARTNEAYRRKRRRITAYTPERTSDDARLRT
jgi:hypothetical protein